MGTRIDDISVFRIVGDQGTDALPQGDRDGLTEALVAKYRLKQADEALIKFAR